ncbi:MAG: 4Fe-4S binding protein [Fibrobacteres bacterium]|nr:4Fe-4S binding protein [Fibrobacterota bacterium]
MAITVIQARCPQNHHCPAMAVCPKDALSQVGYRAPVVDTEKCIDCGKCVKVCPMGALITA